MPNYDVTRQRSGPTIEGMAWNKKGRKLNGTCNVGDASFGTGVQARKEETIQR